jgi:hypothetical protein
LDRELKAGSRGSYSAFAAGNAMGAALKVTAASVA